MNWIIRIYNRWRYRPTLQDVWQTEGDKIVSVTPWRDMLVIATEYRVYIITAGHKVLWDMEIQQIASMPLTTRS